MKVKSNELTRVALNHAVAEASGIPIYISGKTLTRMDMDGNVYWQPSTDWSQAGPIIEREKMQIAYNFDEHIWEAGWDCHVKGWGDTPLVAAMRCYVASKLGDEVEVPDHLYDEAIKLLDERLKLFDPNFDAVKFVPPRTLEIVQGWMEVAGMFPSDEDIKKDLLDKEVKK